MTVVTEKLADRLRLGEASGPAVLLEGLSNGPETYEDPEWVQALKENALERVNLDD